MENLKNVPIANIFCELFGSSYYVQYLRMVAFAADSDFIGNITFVNVNFDF